MIITSEQIRGALAVLNWSRQDLADLTGLSPKTIQRMAEGDGVPSTNSRSLDLVLKAFEEGSDKGRIIFTESGISFVRKP